jgi:mRNA-degrading endonuclease toxin of MazEF toxin-antitoxin module
VIPPALVTALGTRLDPPLDPSGDEARAQLRRELARPEYHDTDLVDRLLRWLERLVGDTVDATTGSSPLAALAATVVVVGIVVGVGLLVSRARATAHGAATARPALDGERISADRLRARAEAALAAGDASAALVDAFRATAVRQIERDRIEDLPQATAHELATALVAVFPEQRAAVLHGADLFDEVLYGERPATRDQAAELLRLDDSLAGRVRR